jgi:translocation and assembly module TamB
MKKPVKWTLVGIAALLAAVLGAATWLVTTEAGLARAIAIAESLESVRIRIDGAQGRLIGPLAVDTIEIAHPRAEIRIAGFEADYEPSELLAGRIAAERVRVSDAELRLQPRAGPKKAPSFMPGGLTLVLDEAAVGRLRLITQRGTELVLSGIRGSAKISNSEISISRARLSAPAWAIAGASGTLYAKDPIAMNVTAAWSLTAERRISGIAHASGDLDRLAVDARIATPGTGSALLELRDVQRALQFEGNAEIDALDLSQWVANPPVGPLRAAFSLSGDRERYTVAGNVKGNGLPEAGVRVDGAIGYADRVVTISRLGLEAPEASVELTGTMRAGDEPAFDVRAAWDALRWPLAGRAVLRSPRGTLEARGWREFDYRVAGTFAPAKVPSFSGTASGRFTESAIVVNESSWNALGGRVTAKGSLERKLPRAWEVAGSASRIDPSRLRKELPGKLDFRYAASGTGFGKDAPLDASLRNLAGSFRGQPASGGGRVRIAGEQYRFHEVKLSLGPARLELDGTWGRGANLDGRLIAKDLSAYLPELGGSVDATLVVRDEEIAVGFTGHNLAYGSHEAVVLSVDGHIDREGQEHSWVRLRSNGLTVAGFPINDTRLSLDGLLHDHSLGFRVGAGEDAVVLRGRGAWQDNRYALALERIDASGPRIARWRLESPTRISAQPEAVELDSTCLVYDQRRFCLEGSWQSGGAWSFAANTQSFPLEALASDAPGKPQFRGLLVFDAKAAGAAGRPWTAEVQAEIRDGALVYKSASGAERTIALGLTRASLQSDARRHRVGLRVTESAALDFAVDLEATRPPGKPFGELPVRGTVKGSTRQIGLIPLFVDAIDNASGEVELDFDIAGTAGAPLVEGEARLKGGALDIYQANLRMRDANATVRLQDASLALDASAKAGGGTLEVDGRFGWQDRRLNGNLALKGDRLLVADVPEARVFASPDLRFALDDRRIDVTGTVEIPQARIAPADTAGAVLVSGDERVVGAEAAAEVPRFDVRTDIRLSLGKKVEIDAYGLSGTVTGAVRTRTGPFEGTLASGEFEVVDGEYKAYARELDVERGRLVFTGGPINDPGVDLRASREIGEYTVGVLARGPLRRPQLTLFSEPALPQAQVASMLVVGRASLQREEGDPESPSAAAAGGAFLAGRVGQRVGLDEVGVAQEAGGGTSLVIGKYLSPRLFVSYGISLVDQINTLKLRYTIGDRWSVSAESGRESAADVEYRIEH